MWFEEKLMKKLGVGTIFVGIFLVVLSLILENTGAADYWDECTDDASTDAQFDACSEGGGEGGESMYWIAQLLFWIGWGIPIIGIKILTSISKSDTSPLSLDDEQ
jgi:hypothetical protein